MALPPAQVGLAALTAGVLAAPTPAASLATLLEPTAGTPAALIVAALGLLVQAAGAWLLLVVVLTLGTRAPTAAGRACRAVLRRCAPAGVRRAVALALGAGLALGLPTPASAAHATHTPSSSPTVSTDARPGTSSPAASSPLSGPAAALPPLDWPGLSPAPPAVPTPDVRAAGARSVVVRPGDTLWELADRSLPAPVSDADRAAEWPRWWAANRDVVGDDPDLLLPGQRLVAPPAR